MNKYNGLKRLTTYLKDERICLFLIFVLSFVKVGLSLLPIQMVGAIMDLMTLGDSSILWWLPAANRTISCCIILFAIFLFGGYAADLIYGTMTQYLGDRVVEKVRNDAMKWVLYGIKPYKEERKEGDIISRLTGDVDSVVRALVGPLNGFLPMILKLVGSLIILYFWNFPLGIIASVLILPLYFSSIWIAKTAKAISTEQREAQGQLVNAISNTLYIIPVIKAWRAEQYESKMFEPYSRKIRVLSKVLIRKFNLFWAVTYVFMGIGLVFSVVFSVNAVFSGEISAGGIAVAYTYMNNVLAPVVNLSRYGNDLFQADASLTRVFSLMPEDLGKESTDEVLERAPKIVFSGVKIRCNENHKLSNVSFTARPNEILALTGTSGVGKSTLLYAAMGYQEIEDGEILIDEDSLDICRNKLLNSAGITYQDSFLVDRSLRENIAFGEVQPSDETIYQLGEKLGIDDILQKRGLDYKVGTRGSNLSGGERRRIAIARGMYHKKLVYFLDEPTAELDEKSRNAVLEVLVRAKQDATIMISTHDEKVIEIANQVVDVTKFIREN